MKIKEFASTKIFSDRKIIVSFAQAQRVGSGIDADGVPFVTFHVLTTKDGHLHIMRFYTCDDGQVQCILGDVVIDETSGRYDTQYSRVWLDVQIVS